MRRNNIGRECGISKHSRRLSKKKELQKLKENDIFDELNFCRQSTISCRWIIREKLKEQQRVVARFVASGFEEDSRQLRTDPATFSHQSFRLGMKVSISNP